MVKESKFLSWQILVAVVAVVFLGGIFFINTFDFSLVLAGNQGNIVTGFVASDAVSENLDIEIDGSYIYELSSDEPIVITSLRLDGSVEGSGIAKIYLDGSDGKRYLIYTNVKKKEKGNLITGAAISVASLGPAGVLDEEAGEDEEIVSGVFYNECRDTCFVAIPFSADKENRFIFELGEDTKLKVSKMSYTIG